MKGQQAASERLSGLAETVVWVVAFCFASTSMTMLNKAAVKALPFPYWLCVLQNVATILLVGAVVSTCVPSGHPTFGLVRSLDWEVVTLWLPAVAMFIVMLVSSLSALHAVSVPTVLVFRSLTPLCTAILESMWLRVRYAWATWASLTLILIGAVCYVIATPRDGDSANNIRGYVWLGVNLFSAAAYHVYVKGMINRLAPSPTDMVLWNNLLSVPALAILGAILDRPGDLPRALSDLDGLGWLWVSSSMVVASAIAFTGFGMQKVLSATSATVVNHANKVAAFVVAFAIFKDALNWVMGLGIALTLAGTVWYGAERLGVRKKSAEKAPSSADGGAAAAEAGAAKASGSGESTSLLHGKK